MRQATIDTKTGALARMHSLTPLGRSDNRERSLTPPGHSDNLLY